MPRVISIAEELPPFSIEQDKVMEFAEKLFKESFKDINRLLTVFQNGQIEKRHFAKDLNWFENDHTFEEKNNAYIDAAVELGAKAISNCLKSDVFLKDEVHLEEIDAIFTISSTGVSTPSIDARIMNILPSSQYMKRIPIWGLGCAGGASGLSRAYEYCLAYPKAKVLVLSVELCSLTFQRNDRSKSNLIGTSLFADGVACALVCGDDSGYENIMKKESAPNIIGTQSTTMPNSEDVMGWEVKNEGLYVVFSKDIPTIIENWLQPNVLRFLNSNGLDVPDLDHFIAHPGGKKVLDAYVSALKFPGKMTETSLNVLKEYGNMSSATILYVLRRFMETAEEGDLGLGAALGPGFSSELLLMRWE